VNVTSGSEHAVWQGQTPYRFYDIFFCNYIHYVAFKHCFFVSVLSAFFYCSSVSAFMLYTAVVSVRIICFIRW
jgi:hypothetical protein